MRQQLIDLAASGAAFRYRPGFGFYAVVGGKHEALADEACVKAIKAGEMRPESGGADKFGVHHFTVKVNDKTRSKQS